MSTSTPVKPTQAPTKPPRHVEILSSQFSQLYANLHPVLLLTLLPISFTSLVRDPVTTLLGLAPTVAILQALYCILCLPSSGQTAPTGSKPGQKKKSGKTAQDIWTKLVPAFLSFILTLTLSTPLLYLILLLFGAPLVSHHPQTLLLSLHLALLTTPHLFYIHGLDPPTWLRLSSLQQPVDETYGLSLGALLGAWVGAIPIPLDWDREWQEWPVTVIVGVYLGAVLGKVVGGYVFMGSRMRIT